MTGGPPSWRWIIAVLAAYTAGLLLVWPRVLLVVDEERYVSQAVAFAAGGTTVEGAGIIHPPTGLRVISNYPPGTSLLQTPFVWLFGWRGAVLLSLLGLIVSTTVTAHWLRRRGRDPAFALLVPGFAGSLLFARSAMSDVPSAAVVAVACALLWRAESGGKAISFLAGFAAGSSLLFREPLAVLLAPLALGALVRRAVGVPWYLAGGVAGIGLRLVLSHALFGSAFYVRDSGIAFDLESLGHTAPLFAFLLLIVIPGGALLPLLYRGERRAELVMAITLYVTLFLFYDYDSLRDHGLLKGTVLSSRFLIPALPLLAFMAADVWPRLVSSWPVRLRRAALGGTRLLAFALVPAAFLVHMVGRRQEREPLAIVDGIYRHTRAETPVVINAAATLKYVSASYGPRRLILRRDLDAEMLPGMVERHGGLSVVLLSRSDGELFRQDADENRHFLTQLAARCALVPRHHATFAWAELRVMEVTHCSSR